MYSNLIGAVIECRTITCAWRILICIQLWLCKKCNCSWLKLGLVFF